jgi:hypothetical protein
MHQCACRHAQQPSPKPRLHLLISYSKSQHLDMLPQTCVAVDLASRPRCRKPCTVAVSCKPRHVLHAAVQASLRGGPRAKSAEASTEVPPQRGTPYTTVQTVGVSMHAGSACAVCVRVRGGNPDCKAGRRSYATPSAWSRLPILVPTPSRHRSPAPTRTVPRPAADQDYRRPSPQPRNAPCTTTPPSSPLSACSPRLATMQLTNKPLTRGGCTSRRTVRVLAKAACTARLVRAAPPAPAHLASTFSNSAALNLKVAKTAQRMSRLVGSGARAYKRCVCSSTVTALRHRRTGLHQQLASTNSCQV